MLSGQVCPEKSREIGRFFHNFVPKNPAKFDFFFCDLLEALSNCDHSQKIVLCLIILPECFFGQSYHLSITKLLILLVVIIFPLLLLYYCFVSAFYRFNCIETVKCIQKNLNFSYRYSIFFISGKKRKRDREFKGPIADRYICTLFLCLFYTRYLLDYLPLSPIFYHPLRPSLVNSQPIGFLVDLFFNFFSIEEERKE